MPQRYFLPFASFAPDDQEFDSPSLDVADNALPVFGTMRPLQQKSTIASEATTGAVTGAHAHLLLATEQIQIGRPISDVSVGVWRGIPGGSFSLLYQSIDEVSASDADYVLNGGGPAGGSSITFQLTSLETPGSNSHIMRWRYRVSNYSDATASVTSITRSSSTATITTSASHGLVTGDTIVVAGATQSEYNGTFAFTKTGDTTGTYTVSGTPATPATGTITWKKGWYIKAELLETSTVRATSTVRGGADADWTAASYTLTAGEYAALSAYTDLRIKFTASVPGVTQELRPVSDVSNPGTWTTGAGSSSNLYAEIDESSADDATTYIKSPALAAGGAAKEYTAALTTSGEDPYRLTSNTVNYRYKATNAGVTIVASLMQGTTVIASNTHASASSSYTNGTFTLSSDETLDITDWGDLRIRFQASYPTAVSSTATQTARPDEDVSNPDSWTGDASPLYTNVDESVASDADAVHSPTTSSLPPVAQELTLGLTSLSDPVTSSDHVLRVRCRRAGSIDVPVHATLMQGGDEIADFDGVDAAGSSYATIEYTLSAAQADSITDYGDLRVRLTRNTDEEGVDYSWIEFSVPEPRTAHVTFAEMETLSLARGEVSWFELQIPDPNNTYNADTQEIYAGVEDAIYEVDQSGFSDVSVAGGYATSGDTPHSWSFASWGGDVLATNYIDEVQSRAAGAALFANLITSTERPNGRFVTVIGPHVVLGDIINAGGTVTGHADMVWWSAIDDAADFDPDPATQSDYQRLRGTPGQIMALVGGIDYGLVFKRNSIYRMTYQGAPLIFSFESISTQVGTPSPRSVVQVDDDVYFWSGNSFYVIRAGRQLEDIGGSSVAKMLKDYVFESRAMEQVQDSDQRVMDAVLIGAYDKYSGLILWFYRGKGVAEHRNDQAVVYRPQNGAWGYVTDSSLDCAALLSLNNVMSDDTHLMKGIVGFSWDGTNSSWWKFNSSSTYAMTLGSKIISAQALTSSERKGAEDNSVRIIGVRPVFAGEPEASTDPVVTVTVTPSSHPLMQDGQDAVTASAANDNAHGVYPVSPPVMGEYFRLSTAFPSLSSQTIKSAPGVELFYERTP